MRYCSSFPFFSACIQKDIIFVGNPLNNKFNNNDYGRTDTAGDCQVLCQETASCVWFNWNKDQRCYLKVAKGTETRKEPGGATGPGFCDGKYNSKDILSKQWVKTKLNNTIT